MRARRLFTFMCVLFLLVTDVAAGPTREIALICAELDQWCHFQVLFSFH